MHVEYINMASKLKICIQMEQVRWRNGHRAVLSATKWMLSARDTTRSASGLREEHDLCGEGENRTSRAHQPPSCAQLSRGKRAVQKRRPGRLFLALAARPSPSLMSCHRGRRALVDGSLIRSFLNVYIPGIDDMNGHHGRSPEIEPKDGRLADWELRAADNPNGAADWRAVGKPLLPRMHNLRRAHLEGR
jgi:hypothetical protein